MMNEAEAQYLMDAVGVGSDGLGGCNDHYERDVPVHMIFRRLVRENPSTLAVLDDVTGARRYTFLQYSLAPCSLNSTFRGLS